MADDIVDISGMPDPGTIGLSPEKEVDPTVGMPDPHALYQQHHGYPAASDEDVAEFMRNPDATPDVRKARSAREGLSALSGLPRIAAVANPVTPVVAAIAGGLGAASGGVPALVEAGINPAHAVKDAEVGNERMRRWSSNVYKLAEYMTPTTKEGGELAEGVLNIPMTAGKSANDNLVRPVLGDNAADAVGDVTQDVATLLPGAGAKGFARGTVKGVKAGARAVKAATADVTPIEGTTYDAAGNAETPSQVKTPPVGNQVTGESLRAAPNPIPAPEGTIANARAPQAAPAAPAAVAHPSFDRLTEDGANAYTLAREAEARRRMAEDGVEPEPYVEPFAGRQAEHEGAVAMRNAQRGSVRLFNSPKEEGPKETPAPEEQSERKQHLDALDTLSGGALPSRRASALTGDYNATGNDWQMKEVGNAPMQQQIASENAALHTAVDNVHKSIGSEFEDSVDPQVMGDRGRVTRGAIQGIEKHFDDATDGIYEAAREQNKGRPIAELKRVKAYLDDDSNFANDAEIGLQRAGKQRLERLWSTGDPDKGVPPGSVNAAEKFREFLNEKGKNPAAMGVANELKGHTDMDVAEHGGPGLFEMARALRRHKYQMLEEPTGIKKLLTPGDSQGINHAIPEHKVMDYIADLPREQHEHVLNVLRAGAHLDPELAEHSAAAIREIQAHTLSRLHDAATDDGGKWNARAFYSAASRYGRNATSTFADRPDILKNLKTINEAGNTLHMDKHYPGASAQGERTGAAGHALEVGGALASGMAHHVPVLGRPLGRIIEAGVEKATGKLSETSRDKEVMKRLVDRNGKQRGSVQIMRGSPASRVKDEFEKAHPEDAPVGYLGKRVGKSTAEIYTDPGDPSTVHLEKLAADAPGSGQGTAALQHITQLADKHGARVTLDAVPQMKGLSRERLMSYYERHGFAPDGNTESSMTREPKTGGSTMNIGLHQGQEGEPGFRKMSKQEAAGAVESTGAKVTKSSVLTPKEHGVGEPTLVASTDRPLSNEEMDKVLSKTKQSAIPQRTDAGAESMHVAPGHEEIAKKEGWDKFNPDYFRQHDGQPLGARMPKQAGRVRVMNEQPVTGAPEGDKPNGKARAAAAAYAKSAGIDYKPLKEYRYVSPDVAKDVADAYEEMKHDPTNPKVKKSYDAFKAETLAQYKQMQKAGVKATLDTDYPYKNPREMHDDVRDNNHMSIYPTEAGFGSGDAAASDHPLMEKAPVKMGGKDATYNDLFRAVHDYYGHAAEGNGFRANGEYNAWRAHRQMYSEAARGAMDAETLGQNSWVNSGPAAAFNKGASGADTVYADQKAGLLPPKVVKAAEEGVGAEEHHITNQLTDSERSQLRADTTKRLVDAFNSAPATKEYAAAALAGAAKRGWYRNSAQAIVNQFGHEAPRFAALLSAMSPQVSVQTNFANALKTYINWDKAGRPEDPAAIRGIMEDSSQKSATAAPGSSNVLDAWVNNAVRALTAEDPSNVKLSGPKVHSFYNNLTDNVHEVTNDAWMASFAKIDPAKLGGGLNKSGPGKSPSYLALSAKVRDAARMISHLTGEAWTPAEVQETVWSWAKTAYEHAEEKGSDVSIPDLVKNGDITDELIRSTPDFHQLFGTSEHRGLLQSSRFAADAPGVAGGKVEGAHAAGSSKARAAAQDALRPHLLSAAARLEQVRQERRNQT